jgi:predicted RNA-binding Zn-ribbon protein involved in translation (DUF1610 family)
MKIIEANSPRFECRSCKSILEIEPQDVAVGYFGANYGGDTPEREYYVTCPICGTDKILRSGEISPAARKAADNKENRQ